MSLLTIVGIAVGLSMDALAVAIAASIVLGRVTGRQVFRFSFHFGLFQALMPILGWLAGQSVAVYITTWDHWCAFALLAYVGGKAVHEAIKEDDDDKDAAPSDPTRGINLLVLSIATSIDAMAVGLSLGVMGESVWYPAVIIGLITGSLTMCGMLFGARIGVRFGKRVEVLGGLILIGIGLKILWQHLTA